MARLTLAEAMLQIPSLLLRGRFDFDFDDLPLHARGLPLRKRLNLLRAGLDAALGTRLSLPPIVQVEPTNACGLRCPLCPTGARTASRPTGHMAWETFQIILDELGDVVVGLLLYSWGEPFLHPRMVDMCSACSERGIATVTSTNGQCLQTLEEAEAVVASGLGAVIIAIDGGSQEVYETYRRGGSVSKAVRCASLLEEAKARRGSATPYTALRAVVTQVNEADLDALERLARELGVNMFSYKSVGSLQQEDALEGFEPSAPPLRRYTYDERGRRHAPPFQCHYPFRQPTIFWDGTVVGCEFDYDLEAPWGRIGETPFADAWRSERATALRRSIRSGTGRPAFCRRCPYQDRMADTCVLTSCELRPATG